jgi:hypothetical protein
MAKNAGKTLRVYLRILYRSTHSYQLDLSLIRNSLRSLGALCVSSFRIVGIPRGRILGDRIQRKSKGAAIWGRGGLNFSILFILLTFYFPLGENLKSSTQFGL